jgi:hypothetical protein
MEETIDTSSGGEAPFGQGAHTLQESEHTRVVFDVAETMSEFPTGDGGIVATLKGRVSGNYDRLKTYKGWTRETCGATTRRMSNTSQETVTASGNGEATITVSIAGNGTYFVATNAEGQMPMTGELNGTLETFGRGCAVTVKPNSSAHVPSTMPIGDDNIGGSGQVSPRTYAVSGQSVTHNDPGSLQQGATYAHTRTTRWDLRRQ